MTAHIESSSDYDGPCKHCSSRNWNELDAHEGECYDCGQTFPLEQTDCEICGWPLTEPSFTDGSRSCTNQDCKALGVAI